MLRRAVLSVLLALTAGVTPVVTAAQPQSQASAGITRLEITRVESPTFDGRAFGSGGQYEKLVGRAYGQVDPSDPRNSVITDLSLAPRNASGMVDYVTDIFVLKPLDPSRSNHRLFFDVNNRGDMRALSTMDNATTGGNDPTAAGDSGNGFLLEQGYTIVSAGWDATVQPGNGRLTISVPVARNTDGTTITGPALEELVVDDSTTTTLPLTYAANSTDKSQANLTVRVRYEDPPTPVPASTTS